MYQLSGSTQAALDYNSTIIGALELSEKKWVLAVQLPGVSRHSRHVLEACGDGLASFVERLKARCAAAGRKIARVILTHEAGRDGFWLARFLISPTRHRGPRDPAIEPTVDRRARRAKTDIIDVEMLLRTKITGPLARAGVQDIAGPVGQGACAGPGYRRPRRPTSSSARSICPPTMHFSPSPQRSRARPSRPFPASISTRFGASRRSAQAPGESSGSI